MATDVEYALMAGRIYQSTRREINWFPDLLSLGWTERIDKTQSLPSGFEATYFAKGSEIVISFAGTGSNVDWWANAGGFFGVTSEQLRQAADYYLRVKAANPGATISLTGHSLGGGLASLMAVFFGETATTFDQAPFRNSANATVAAILKDYLLNQQGYSETVLQGLTNFINTASDGVIPGESNVRDFSVQGEILSAASGLRIGTPTSLTHGADLTLTFDLHSQALLTAFLQSEQTAPAQHSFREATFKLPDVVRMIFDNKLFAHSTARSNTTDENFIDRLIRHQNGVAGLTTGEAPTTADAMLTRFTADLWKLAQDGGLTMRDANPSNPDLNEVSKTLIAFAMQKYYEENLPLGAAPAELFTEVTGGIQFDMADVSQTIKASFDANSSVNLSDAKGFDLYLKNYLLQENVFAAEERGLIQSLLPYMRDWYVQAGGGGMNATGILDHGAFMLGGTGNDALTGGSAADLLIGNAGDDILMGGTGNDTLLGGKGDDTYVYQTGDGLDAILDSDGQGRIIHDGITLAGGAQYGDARVHRDADNHYYVDVGRGLVIDGNLMIQNYQSGNLALAMTETVAQAMPQTSRDIKGDLTPRDTDPAADGVQTALDDLDNIQTDGTAAADRADILSDSTGNDRITSGGGNDQIHATRGGDDVIEAGAGSDMVNAGSGNDHLYADTQMSIAAAIAAGNDQTGSSARGDWLNGGAGNDTLTGSTAQDVLAGGIGADLLIGGAGDDLLMGDNDIMPTADADWTWRYDPAGQDAILTSIAYNTPAPDSGADPLREQSDVLYAGEGNDLAFGGRGNDVIFGETGADVLRGDSGSDILLGGDGTDILIGDLTENNTVLVTPGNDYLDGGAQDDLLYGNEGDDILIGGAGNDTLYGGTGKDTYIINRGDGRDTIIDTQADNNIIRFGEGISASGVTLRLGSLMVDLGNGDEVHIDGFDQLDVFNSVAINSFAFADGTVLTTNELLARGFDLDGTGLDETIAGTNTTDRINGFGGADVLAGFGGDDVLDGGAGNDELQGGDGDDILMGGEGDDVLFGEVGNDILFGNAGNDELQGGDGNDTLMGGEGADILLGEAGNDLLKGGDGEDTYIFNLGDDIDTIDDSQGVNRVRFGDGITPDSLQVSVFNAGDDYRLRIGYGNQSDYVSIKNGAFRAADTFEFADGTVLSTADLMLLGGPAVATGTYANETAYGSSHGDVLFAGGGNDQVYGRGGDDTLDGGAGNDTIAGGAGNDLMVGGAGDDTYLFNAGDGIDIVLDSDGTNQIVFGGGLDAAGLELSQGYGEDGKLYLHFDFGGDRLSIADGPNGGVQSYRFADGSVFQVEREIHGTIGNDFLVGGSGNDRLDGGSGNDTLSGGDGDDRLTGGAGDDTLIGGAGADIYRFSHGMGNDTIVEQEGGTNELRLDANISLADLTASREGNDLLVGLLGNTGGVRLQDYFSGNSSSWQVRYANDSVMSAADFLDNLASATDSIDKAISAFKNVVRNEWITGHLQRGFVQEADGNYHFRYDNLYSDDLPSYLFRQHSDASRSFAFETRLGNGTESIVSDNSVFTGFSTIQDSTTYIGPVGSGSFFTPGPGEKPRFIPVGINLGYIVPAGWTTLHVSDAAGRLSGTWLYPPDFALETGNTAKTNLRTQFFYSQHSILLPEFHAGDANNTIVLEGSGIIDGDAGDDTLQASSGNDIDGLTGRTFLHGNGGNDKLGGGYYDDVLIGGRGTDYLDGSYGADTYRVLNEDSIDVISDSGEDFDNYSRWYYHSQGYSDREMEQANSFFGLLAGKWILWSEGGGMNETPTSEWVFDSYEEACAYFTDAWGAPSYMSVLYVRPLPELPSVNANDYAALASFYESDAIQTDKVIFGPGIMQDDLDVAVGDGYASLILTGPDGTGVELVLATADDPIGTGIDIVQFDDGSELTMQQLAAMADVNHVRVGTNGADTMRVGNGADTVSASEGNDIIETYGGNDILDGGSGDDYLQGGTGNDVYLFGRGSGADIIDQSNADATDIDVIRLAGDISPSDVTLSFDDGALRLTINDTGDSIVQHDWLTSNVRGVARIEFADGTVWRTNDLILPGENIVGTGIEDWLYGTEGNDTLSGLAGNDALTGGLGDDTYLFSAGDGVDHVIDSGGTDTIVFGTGITADSLSLGLGSLLVRVGSGSDAIHIEGFNPDDALGSSIIENFTFADGTSLTHEQLLVRGFDLSGSGSISGTNLTDRITGSDGDDTMISGAGNDTLNGGAGNDTYLFNLGDGVDTVRDALQEVPLGDIATAGQGNRIAFGAGIARDDLRFEHGDGTLTIRYSDDDAVVLPGFNLFDTNGTVVAATIAFADGTTASLAELVDQAPVASSDLAALSTEEDAVFTFRIPAEAFSDADQGDTLIWSAMLADGCALPEWLGFDAATRTFAGTPLNADARTIAIRVIATDIFGKTANQVFELTVNNINDAPIVAQEIADQSATQDQPFSFAVPAGTFADVDLGDTLTCTATLGTGEALPSWLEFNTATGMFNGAPANADVGQINITVTAMDGAGVVASSSFTLAIANVNDAPIVANPIVDQAATEDEPFRFTLPANTFIDIDVDDTLTLTATLANGDPLPDWLAFDTATQTFSGRPGEDDLGDLRVQVTATDVEGLAAAGIYMLNVAIAPDRTLLGTGDADVLIGASGNDTLDGAGGADMLIGKRGNDTYVVDNTGDSIVEKIGEGIDTVRSSITWTLGAHLENLTLTSAAIGATGNALDNVVTGNDLDNTLSGGAGADTMIGGAGGDTYFIDDVDDLVIEAAGDGIDTVNAGINYTLGANIENLTLTGIAMQGVGNELDNILIGNDLDNTLLSGAGNDVLDGGAGSDTLAGGMGNDFLLGGDGNDTYLYHAGDSLDQITDTAGIDTLRFGPGLTLENVALRIITVNGQKIAQVRVLDGEGCEQGDQGFDFMVTMAANGQIMSPIEKFVFANGQHMVLNDLLIKQASIYGTNKNDILIGSRNDDAIFGGNRNDMLYGGTGNDTLDGGNGVDVLYGGGGTDKLYGGNQSDTLYGECGNDKLYGGNGSDLLDAGEGDDLLDGANSDDLIYAGAGNDTVYAGNGDDYVAAGEGDDRIWAGNGRDIVQAGSGNDIIGTETNAYANSHDDDDRNHEDDNDDDGDNANDLVDAGDGDDIINTGNGRDWIAGGKGNDTIDTGSGRNLFAFNRGDGADVIHNSRWGNDTISIGKGIRYADLTLAKSGNDLVFGMGQDDSITLKNWYADARRGGMERLQAVTGAEGGDYDASSTDKTMNRQVELYDFGKLVQRFDAVRAATPALSQWAVMNGLLDAHLSGSNTAAVGGDLSYQYAVNGSLGGIGLAVAQDSLSSGNFNGHNPQALHARTQLDQGMIKLG